MTHVPSRTTQSESRVEGPPEARRVPGALVVFSIENPVFARIELAPNVPTRWARHDIGGLRVDDTSISRGEHLELRFADGKFHLENRSEKGTRLNGARFMGRAVAESGAVIRLGKTCVMLLDDVSPYEGGVELEELSLNGAESKTFVLGPVYREVLDRIASARARNRNIVVFAERGVGKEFAAHHFFRSHKTPGPFKRFNCSQFSAELAASELFGVLGGIATTVKARDGLLQGANKGVLFLDEIVELPIEIQPKFLRALDPGEVQPVGWEKEPIRIDVRYFCASNQRIGDRVRDGRFRGDLYDRLRQEEIDLPPLRERVEEIPWLMHLQTEAAHVGLHSSAVEAALLYRWPGNVRELLNVIEQAIGRALQARSDLVRVEHLQLPPDSGGAFGAPPVPPRPPPDGGSSPPVPPSGPAGGSPPPAAPAEKRGKHSKEELLAALEANGWVITRTADALGLHPTQLRRDMKALGIKKPATFGKDEDEKGDVGEGPVEREVQ